MQNICPNHTNCFKLKVGKDFPLFLRTFKGLSRIELFKACRKNNLLIQEKRNHQALYIKKHKNRLDDLYSLTANGREKLNSGKGETINFFHRPLIHCRLHESSCLEFPIVGLNCKRLCGGAGSCSKDCDFSGKKRRKRIHNCSVRVVATIYLKDIKHYHVRMFNINDHDNFTANLSRLPLNEDDCDKILKYQSLQNLTSEQLSIKISQSNLIIDQDLEKHFHRLNKKKITTFLYNQRQLNNFMMASNHDRDRAKDLVVKNEQNCSANYQNSKDFLFLGINFRKIYKLSIAIDFKNLIYFDLGKFNSSIKDEKFDSEPLVIFSTNENLQYCKKYGKDFLQLDSRHEKTAAGKIVITTISCKISKFSSGRAILVALSTIESSIQTKIILETLRNYVNNICHCKHYYINEGKIQKCFKQFCKERNNTCDEANGYDFDPVILTDTNLGQLEGVKLANFRGRASLFHVLKVFVHQPSFQTEFTKFQQFSIVLLFKYCIRALLKKVPPSFLHQQCLSFFEKLNLKKMKTFEKDNFLNFFFHSLDLLNLHKKEAREIYLLDQEDLYRTSAMVDANHKKLKMLMMNSATVVTCLTRIFSVLVGNDFFTIDIGNLNVQTNLVKQLHDSSTQMNDPGQRNIKLPQNKIISLFEYQSLNEKVFKQRENLSKSDYQSMFLILNENIPWVELKFNLFGFKVSDNYEDTNDIKLIGKIFSNKVFQNSTEERNSSNLDYKFSNSKIKELFAVFIKFNSKFKSYLSDPKLEDYVLTDMDTGECTW
ncbi:hypothetical protein HK099_007143 [Clydaea vesicula]|uniref:Uncharacterized protein n=1 Tax=Clydaea vesicula TaxID=447962 RepID=A0AAD5U5M3_9FUNG|nr:hypothetical protein HK099_007143 [Clydaea vesicula]